MGEGIRCLKLATHCFQSMSQCLLSPCHTSRVGVYLWCIRLEIRKTVNDRTLECAWNRIIVIRLGWRVGITM